MSNQCCKPIYFQAFYHHPKSEEIYDVAHCKLHNMFYGRTVQPKIKVVVHGITITRSLSSPQIFELCQIFMTAFIQKEGLICALCAVYV